MEIVGFNRVELVVREDQIDSAVAQFNELLGLNLPRPHPIEGVPVLSATDFDGFIEFVAPIDGKGPFGPGWRSTGRADRTAGLGDRRRGRGETVVERTRIHHSIRVRQQAGQRSRTGDGGIPAGTRPRAVVWLFRHAYAETCPGGLAVTRHPTQWACSEAVGSLRGGLRPAHPLEAMSRSVRIWNALGERSHSQRLRL